MNLQRWLENSLKLQSIPAPTFHEAARAEFIYKEFLTCNLQDVSMDQDNNVFARIPGESKTPLIISAHLDSVFPFETSLASERKGHRLYGPGIGDNAISLGALLEIAHDFADSLQPNDVWLVANVGEEGLGNLLGMRRVVERFGVDVLAYLVLEGMALGYIYHRGLPIHRYRITANTVGGHAWIHAGRASAIHAICELGGRLSQIDIQKDRKWSLNIGRIEGGTSINTIAPKAAFELDLRAEGSELLQLLDSEVRTAIEDALNAEVDFEVTEIGNRPGGEIPADHPLIIAACRALEDAGLKDYQLETGSTDASIPLSMNIPSICIGLTYGSDAHSLGEYIEIRPLEIGYRALKSTIESCFLLDN
jgi:acetylornithine deacetylase/succinyl-diaminopimelate desuccinylase-like protein